MKFFCTFILAVAMALRANFQKSYLFRYLVFILVCVPLGFWFLYDGIIAWPKQLPMIRAYEAIDKDLEQKEIQDKWHEIAKANGWSKSPPKKTLVEMESAINGQYLWAFLSFLVGAIAATYYLRSKNAWVEETESGLKTSWGQSLDYAKVTKVDKAKWETKGIAKAFYFEKGQRRVFTFDDFKFDRPPLGRMLYNLEQVIPISHVVGGPLEPTPADLVPPPVETASNTAEISSGPSSAPPSESASS
jgi:hypothetical protein